MIDCMCVAEERKGDMWLSWRLGRHKIPRHSGTKEHERGPHEGVLRVTHCAWGRGGGVTRICGRCGHVTLLRVKTQEKSLERPKSG